MRAAQPAHVAKACCCVLFSDKALELHSSVDKQHHHDDNDLIRESLIDCVRHAAGSSRSFHLRHPQGSHTAMLLLM